MYTSWAPSHRAPHTIGALQEKNIKHSGNLTLDDIITIARAMRPRSMARELSGTVKEVLGTAK
jgi:large subunit ribosomal protein L12e